ncbi:MAG: CAP domain-containing protein [Bradymonadales bacterium]
MKKILKPSIVLGFFTLLQLAFCGASSQLFAYGESKGDFPTLEERQLLLLANEARNNTTLALTDCKQCGEAHCYKEHLPPLYYDYELSRASRFHSQIMAETECFEHRSPCVLKDKIAQSYPSCKTTRCACKSDVVCDNKGDTAFTRVRKFNKKFQVVAENIAMSTLKKAEFLFKVWLWEASPSKECKANDMNGHRWTVLSEDYNRTGLGYWKGYATQNFSHLAEPAPSPISAGIHFEKSWGLLFKAHWYSDLELSDFKLNIDNQCVSMSILSQGAGIVLAYEARELPAKFNYRFEAQDKSGKTHYYPSKGALQRGGHATWTKKKLKTCAKDAELNELRAFRSSITEQERAAEKPCDACADCGSCRLEENCTFIDGVKNECKTTVHCENCP